MTYLSIDYGARHVGIAVADGLLAQPLMTVSTKGAFEKIKQIATERKIVKIIVGLVEKSFLEKLQSLGLPIEEVDETLSSHDARQALLHTTQKRRRENEHQVAAAIMLQRWLDDSPHA